MKCLVPSNNASLPRTETDCLRSEGDRAGIRPVRRCPFALAQRPAAFATGDRLPFRGARHADRLRHFGRAALLSGKGIDLVLSGINRCSNAGEDVIYSGVVAGAMEGTLLDVPSIALSQAYRSRSCGKPYWETSLHFAPDMIRRLFAKGTPRDVLVNVNFPLVHRKKSGALRWPPRGAAGGSGQESMYARTAAAIPTTGSPTNLSVAGAGQVALSYRPTTSGARFSELGE
jgi:hypothetical protein